MVYIFGKSLKSKKRVEIGLRAIYGLGFFQIKLILNLCSIGKNIKIKELSQNQIIVLCKKIDQNKILIESQLKKFLDSDLKLLIDIKSFKSLKKKIKNVN